jgi:UTP--glucose-1-phosphate uridylyltransferase
MAKIKKAIIPAAGLGTRFLPATKTVPKEMLTIVDTPIIFYVIEEALNAGIEDIVLVQGRGKTAIEDFFDISFELEHRLEAENRFDLLTQLKKIRESVNLISIRQKQPLGLGHAVLCAERVIGAEPFAVLLGDEIFDPLPGQETVTMQLIKSFEAYSASSLSVMKVDDVDVPKYGIADVQDWKDQFFKVKNLIEKPKPSETASRWAVTGRYLLTPDVFNFLKETKPGKNSEIQLTDAINKSAQINTVLAKEAQVKRYDAGDKLGYLIANIELGLKREELKNPLSDYIKKLAKRI